MFEWLFGKNKVAVQVPESAPVYLLYYPADMANPDGDKCYVATYETEADAHAVALEDEVEHYSIERNDGNGRLFSVVHIQ
jgi:hypothetical protein